MSQAHEDQGTDVRAARRDSERHIAAWAVGETRAMSERERRLTAAVLVQLPGVLAHVRREGTLPPLTPFGGREIGLHRVVQRRGLDIEPSDAEREVLAALGSGADVPGGRVVLIERRRE